MSRHESESALENRLDRPFSRGFLISKGQTDRIPQSWHATTLGTFTLRTDPRTEMWTRDARDQTLQTIFIGTPIDLSRPNDSGASVARRAMAALSRTGIQGLLEVAAPLGGRFVLVARHNETLYVIPDCAATVPVFWHRGDAVLVGSHVKLVAEVARVDVDETTARLIELRLAHNPRYTVHQPALLTHYEGVRPVFANCLLEIDMAKGSADHRRFYPFAPVPPSDFEAAFEMFEETLSAHVSALTMQPAIGISLTAGLDSRTTLAAAMRVARRKELFAFTYINFSTAGEEEARDVIMANRLAYERGIAHVLLRTDVPDNPQFDRMYSATFGKAGQARKIAQALYEQLPTGFTELMSNVAEIGSVFYKNREQNLYEPESLAAVYGHSPEFGQEPEARAAFSDYIRYSDFEQAAHHGLDPYDLFYWEHRLTRWASVRFQEAQLGHRLMLPFNARPILEAMLSAPKEDRQSKRFQTEFLARFE